MKNLPVSPRRGPEGPGDSTVELGGPTPSTPSSSLPVELELVVEAALCPLSSGECR